MTSNGESRAAFSVARIGPWRYAVCLEHRPDIPAVPFWSEANARAFMGKSRARFPDKRTLLLRHRPFSRKVEVVDA